VEDPVFDPSQLKKKKKKKKKTGAADAEEPSAEATAEPATEEAPDEEASTAAGDEDATLDLPDKKKKKKKKKEVAVPEEEEDDANFGTFDASKMPPKKKKRKPNADAAVAKRPAAGASAQEEADEEQEEHDFDEADDNDDDDKPVKKEAPVWHGLDRWYTYDELLTRIFSMLSGSASNADRRAFKMKPPVVVPDGTKRHILVNFSEICNLMNRLPDHLLSYMLAELGTSGSMDGQGRVTFKYAGRKAQKHMESVIKQYIKEYVLCKLCKSPDTKLNKDQATRLHFMVCGSCGASRSVNPIKSGFQAQIGKRKKRA